LGFCYEGSPIIWPDGTPPLPITGPYIPSTRPGTRAPHAWLPDGRSTLDLFGDGFTLVLLGNQPSPPDALLQAARRVGMPVSVVDIDQPEIISLYERKMVLVRPDGHVAWRGDTVPDDPVAVIDRIRGASTSIANLTTADLAVS
jgi:hypothetical protein